MNIPSRLSADVPLAMLGFGCANLHLNEGGLLRFFVVFYFLFNAANAANGAVCWPVCTRTMTVNQAQLLFIFSAGVTSPRQGLVEGGDMKEGSCRDETHLLSARPAIAFVLSRLQQSPDYIAVILNQTGRKIQTILFPLSGEQSKCLSGKDEGEVPLGLQKGPQPSSAPAPNVLIAAAPT